jgi:hypothetical protein
MPASKKRAAAPALGTINRFLGCCKQHVRIGNYEHERIECTCALLVLYEVCIQC